MNEFAVLDIGYLHYDNYIRVRVRSSTAVHLTCYFTDKTPVRHKATRLVRGATISAGAYWCFVGYLQVEQDEAGDTLIHTFTVPDWSFGQVKWCLFQGTISGVESPSVSPYFKHAHNNWPVASLILRPGGQGVACQIKFGTPYGCPNHWDNVNEAVPDEDASQVASFWITTTFYQSDFYTFANLPPASALIDRITLTLRLRRQGGMAYVRLFYYQLYLAGSYDLTGPYAIGNINYADFTKAYVANPFTSQRWTFSEVSALQAGLAIRSYWGVGWSSYALCTQVFLTIHFDFLIQP